MDYKRIFEAGYTTQYFIRGFFIRNDNGELDKKYWGGRWPDGGSYWVNNLKFDILEGGRHQDGAAWKKEKPTDDFLKEIWNDWHCKSMDEDYSGIDHLEIWQAQKMGTYLKSRWQGAMKVDSFKLTESKLKEGDFFEKVYKNRAENDLVPLENPTPEVKKIAEFIQDMMRSWWGRKDKGELYRHDYKTYYVFKTLNYNDAMKLLNPIKRELLEMYDDYIFGVSECRLGAEIHFYKKSDTEYYKSRGYN